MWSTPDGERILQGAEAKLFREALAMIVDMVCDDAEGCLQFSAPPFDKLQPNQKLAVLAEVGSALLQENQPIRRLTAVREAAVGAVYEAIMLIVEMEINQPAEERTSPTWRELVLTACQEQGIDELLDPASEEIDEWGMLISCLTDAVLWDEDWRDSESLMDVDPKAGRAVKEMLGIDEDYYVAVPPDPTDEEMKAVWTTLRGLTRGGS
ncbi:MAG: hypothetical protein ACLP9L_04850 [Thermoguttaceae bacterium]